MPKVVIFSGVELNLTRQEKAVFDLINQAGNRGQSMDDLIYRLNLEQLEHPDRAVWRWLRGLRLKLESHGYTITHRHRHLLHNYKIVRMPEFAALEADLQRPKLGAH